MFNLRDICFQRTPKNKTCVAVGRRQQPSSAWITRDCSTQLAWMCRKPQGKNCYKLHDLEIRVIKPQGKNYYKLHDLEVRVIKPQGKNIINYIIWRSELWRVTEQGNMIYKYSRKSTQDTMCMKFRAVSMAKESLIVLWPSKHVCLKSKELLGEMNQKVQLHDSKES